jgi:hypothetical protein
VSSASRPSASVVKPTRSAKRIETSRRSATGALVEVAAEEIEDVELALEDAALAAVTPATSGVAHSPQNFDVDEFVAPHDGQIAASALPHSPQNLRPASLVNPQLLQTTHGSRLL